MILKFVIILQNLIKAYHRKSGKSKYDRKLTELDVETTRIWSRVDGVLEYFCCHIKAGRMWCDFSRPILIGSHGYVRNNKTV